MPIFTSYIGLWRKYKDHMPEGVLITASKPDWWEGVWRPDLAPDLQDVLDYKSRILTWEDLKSRYLTKIQKLGPGRILNSLPADCTLLCWEKKGIPCHRNVLAFFLSDKQTGVQVAEFRMRATSGYSLTRSFF